jgi:hypothetical protein
MIPRGILTLRGLQHVFLVAVVGREADLENFRAAQEVSELCYPRCVASAVPRMRTYQQYATRWTAAPRRYRSGPQPATGAVTGVERGS